MIRLLDEKRVIKVFEGQINGTTPAGTEPIFAALAVLNFLRQYKDIIPTEDFIAAVLDAAAVEVHDVDSAEEFVMNLTRGQESWEDYYDSDEIAVANTMLLDLELEGDRYE